MANKKLVMLLLLLCSFSFTSCSSTEEDTTVSDTREEQAEVEEQHEVVQPKQVGTGKYQLENNNFQLTLDEATLGITVKDKATGFEYESVRMDESSNASWQGFLNSGVSVEFYSQKSTMPERVDLQKGTPEITYTYYNDGFDASLYYKFYDFSLTVEVRLTDDGITVEVDKDSIIEGETYKLGSIYLYPMLGATKLGDVPGYMFVPEGAGALIDLKDNNAQYKSPYSKKIYGDNAGVDKFATVEANRPAIKEPEEITMPVFGMVYTEDEQGFLGIVEKGQYNAEILAYPNGVTTEFNWVTTKFNFRDIYTMQTAATSGVPTYEKVPYMRDIKINYKFVNKDEANYTGLAKEYQSYLIDNEVLEKQEDHFQLKLDFFGGDSKKWLLFDVVVPMTSVEQIDSITSDLIAEGVTNILPVYTGWQKDGISLAYGSGNYEIDENLGTQKELNNLIEKLKDQNIDFVLKQDFLKANTTRFYNTTKDIVKGISQLLVEEPTNAKVFESMYYLTPSKSKEFASDFIEHFENTGVENVELTSITNTLFSYYSGGEVHSRGETANDIVELTEQFENIKLSMERPNEYLWKSTSKYFDMPLSTSNYAFLSKEIPFLPIVLKGYIPFWAADNNFEANEKEYYLKMIEYGAYPSFLVTNESPNKLRDTNSSYIYTSQYEVLKDSIKSYYTDLGDVLSQVEGVSIKTHEYIAEQVVSVVYENGVEFVINYSNQDYQSGDITVAAMSYAVK